MTYLRKTHGRKYATYEEAWDAAMKQLGREDVREVAIVNSSDGKSFVVVSYVYTKN